MALLEATAFDRDREGETLPPEINPVFRELGLWEGFQSVGAVEAPGLVSVWGDSRPAESDFVCNAFGSGWHIDRNRFDRMLCEAAVAAGAEFFSQRAVRHPVRQDGCWRFCEITTQVVVDASGRNGLALGGRQNVEVEDRMIAIVLRLSCSKSTARDLRTYIEAAPQGWWYTAPIPEQRMTAMFFTDRAAYARGALLLDQLREAPMTRARLQDASVSSRRVVSVRSACARRIFGEGWILVGDSASSYDPLSGRGIFKALRHGAAAAEALDSRMRGKEDAFDAYAARVQREFRDYARQRRMYYAMESRWPAESFWQARSREAAV